MFCELILILQRGIPYTDEAKLGIDMVFEPPPVHKYMEKIILVGDWKHYDGCSCNECVVEKMDTQTVTGA